MPRTRDEEDDFASLRRGRTFLEDFKVQRLLFVLESVGPERSLRLVDLRRAATDQGLELVRHFAQRRGHDRMLRKTGKIQPSRDVEPEGEGPDDDDDELRLHIAEELLETVQEFDRERQDQLVDAALRRELDLRADFEDDLSRIKRPERHEVVEPRLKTLERMGIVERHRLAGERRDRYRLRASWSTFAFRYAAAALLGKGDFMALGNPEPTRLLQAATGVRTTQEPLVYTGLGLPGSFRDLGGFTRILDTLPVALRPVATVLNQALPEGWLLVMASGNIPVLTDLQHRVGKALEGPP